MFRSRFLLTAAVVVAVLPGLSRAGYYTTTNLVSNNGIPGTVTDPTLVNAWGISFPNGGPFWVSDNGTGVSTLYNGQGARAGGGLTVIIPPPASMAGATSAPTGQVFNSGGTTSFFVTNPANGASGRATFMFATEDGTISGWNSAIQTSGTPAGANKAFFGVDNSASGAVYKGLALVPGAIASSDALFAANFHSGALDKFNNTFGAAGSFSDPSIPTGFAPFNVQRLSDGRLYVTFAKQDAAGHDDMKGAGNGFVDIFDPTTGTFTRLISNGQLNSPWGLALAPSDFGQFSNDLLVGNFGDGRINAFNPTTGAFLGSLSDGNGNPLRIGGLWGLTFRPDLAGTPDNRLFFTAGPNGEQNGLFGFIDPVTVPEPTSVSLFLMAGAGLWLLRRRKMKLS